MLCADGRNVCARDGFRAAGLGEEKLVQRAELLCEGRLIYTFREIEVDLGSAKDAGAGADGVVGKADLWICFRSIKLVVQQAAAQGKEEAIPEVPLDLRGVVVVRSVQLLVYAIGFGIL